MLRNDELFPPTRTAMRGVRCAVLLLLGAAVIFCHGCHAGDHDDELLVSPIERR